MSRKVADGDAVHPGERVMRILLFSASAFVVEHSVIQAATGDKLGVTPRFNRNSKGLPMLPERP